MHALISFLHIISNLVTKGSSHMPFLMCHCTGVPGVLCPSWSMGILCDCSEWPISAYSCGGHSQRETVSSSPPRDSLCSPTGVGRFTLVWGLLGYLLTDIYTLIIFSDSMLAEVCQRTCEESLRWWYHGLLQWSTYQINKFAVYTHFSPLLHSMIHACSNQHV